VAIVVANIPAARDRRVLREADALLRAGARVTVVSPRDDQEVRTGEPRGHRHGATILPGAPGVRLVTYRRRVEGSGPLGFAAEFAGAVVGVARALGAVQRLQPLDVVQFCNPPDVFAPLMLRLRRQGCRVVFDHHDLSPEIYQARGHALPALSRLLLLLERWSLRAADAVVATNESFRDVAVGRGGRDPRDVVVVRNGPRLDELPARPLERARPPVVAYLGVMGRQDGVDAFVRMAALVHDRRPEARFVLVGDGERLPDLRALCRATGLDGVVRFTGWLPPAEVARELAAAAIGVQPDPRNAMNELSTMAKTVEYLAHGLAVVAVDLVETRRTCGDAAVYVPDSSPAALADAVVGLLDDPPRREALGRVGAGRVAEALSWDHQAVAYVDLFRRWFPALSAPAVRVPAREPWPADGPDAAAVEVAG
jgi:glycosyltransferase involved in cell wall biosynthesis